MEKKLQGIFTILFLLTSNQTTLFAAQPFNFEPGVPALSASHSRVVMRAENSGNVCSLKKRRQVASAR